MKEKSTHPLWLLKVLGKQSIQMARAMREDGKMASIMVQAGSSGLMVRFTRGGTKLELRKEMESIAIALGRPTKVAGRMADKKAKGYYFHPMELSQRRVFGKMVFTSAIR